MTHLVVMNVIIKYMYIHSGEIGVWVAKFVHYLIFVCLCDCACAQGVWEIGKEKEKV